MLDFMYGVVKDNSMVCSCDYYWFSIFMGVKQMLSIKYRAVEGNDTERIRGVVIHESLCWQDFILGVFNLMFDETNCRLIRIFSDVYAVWHDTSLVGYVAVTNLEW